MTTVLFILFYKASIKRIGMRCFHLKLLTFLTLIKNGYKKLKKQVSLRKRYK